MNKDIFEKGTKIKIIGDSIAAGAGSSMSYKTEELIFEDNNTKFFKRVAPNSWWGLFQQYLRDNYVSCIVENKGCGGAFSYQINKYLDTLISDDDKLIFVLMGLNDRKRENGMEELKTNCECVVDKLISKGKIVILLTPPPSTHSNEYYANRIYHTNEVIGILRNIANSRNIPLIDNYKYVIEYLEKNQLVIDDIIYGDGCENDGLHPSDHVQKLMFQNLIETLIWRRNRSFMNLTYIKAKKEDADMLIKIYNASFYDDYIKYGECPAYGRTRERMEASIEKFPKLIIYCDDVPAGVISVENKGEGEYYLGCLCVIPKYQSKGIGTQAVKYMLGYYKDWSKITLITPADKEENIDFYTKKCGFVIDGIDMDGNVKVVHFLMER